MMSAIENFFNPSLPPTLLGVILQKVTVRQVAPGGDLAGFPTSQVGAMVIMQCTCIA
jgi:hypothetical protein